MSILMMKDYAGKWLRLDTVSDMKEAEEWARNRFKDYNDGILKRVITGVVVQGNMIYLYYDIRLEKDGNTFPVKVVMKVVENES